MRQDILNSYFFILNKIKNEKNPIINEQYRIILNSTYGKII
jgi:hypothetical protein